LIVLNKNTVKRFSSSVPPKLLEDFDEVVMGMGYSRSQAVQLAMRNFLTEYRWMREEKELGAGALTMIYDHETRSLTETLTGIQHEYRSLISSTTHVHLDERNCLEIVAVKGEVKAIRTLAQKLMKERGVKQLKIATLIF
jgi:CopG family nickel-responsive transcriptional regulator